MTGSIGQEDPVVTLWVKEFEPATCVIPAAHINRVLSGLMSTFDGVEDTTEDANPSQFEQHIRALCLV